MSKCAVPGCETRTRSGVCEEHTFSHPNPMVSLLHRVFAYNPVLSLGPDMNDAELELVRELRK